MYKQRVSQLTTPWYKQQVRKMPERERGQPHSYKYSQKIVQWDEMRFTFIICTNSIKQCLPSKDLPDDHHKLVLSGSDPGCIPHGKKCRLVVYICQDHWYQWPNPYSASQKLCRSKNIFSPTSKDSKILLALIFLEHFSLGYIKTDPTGCQGKS